MLKLRHSMQTARNTALEFMTQKYKIEAHTLLTQKDISESNLSSADKLMMSDLKSVYDATSTPHREDIRNITEKRYGLVLDGNAENDLYNYLDNRINYPEKILPKKDLPRRSPSRESIS